MTLHDLYLRCKNNGMNYSYGLFKTPQEPPHLVAMTSNTNNFMADNKVYKKKLPIILYYTYKDKDIEQMNLIEDTILEGIGWNKTEETYLSDENVWQVSYFFELDNIDENTMSV